MAVPEDAATVFMAMRLGWSLSEVRGRNRPGWNPETVPAAAAAAAAPDWGLDWLPLQNDLTEDQTREEAQTRHRHRWRIPLGSRRAGVRDGSPRVSDASAGFATGVDVGFRPSRCGASSTGPGRRSDIPPRTGKETDPRPARRLERGPDVGVDWGGCNASFIGV